MELQTWCRRAPYAAGRRYVTHWPGGAVTGSQCKYIMTEESVLGVSTEAIEGNTWTLEAGVNEQADR